MTETAHIAEIEETPHDESELSNFPQEKSSEERSDERFVDGQILKFIRVRFPGNAKSFPFLFGKRRFEYGKKVVAMSDRGMAVGYINSFPYEVPFSSSLLPLKGIHKFATDHDVFKDQENQDKEKKTRETCRDLVEKHRLDMDLTHVELTQFGKKAVIYFTSPARVDFRDLVKDLVQELKMRIELRQIGLRDRTAALGGIGPCGLQLCCSSFLSKYGQVNLKMAKNQNLALNPTRLNGVCGQLKCCLQYEDEVYKEKISRLPPIGSFIQTMNGDRGKVERHHTLIEQFDMITDEGKKRSYAINQYKPDQSLPEGWKFPPSFEHVVDERSVVIGLPPKILEKV
jgi:cell fate regulator YaaT (PSP1 superfamily)